MPRRTCCSVPAAVSIPQSIAQMSRARLRTGMPETIMYASPIVSTCHTITAP